MTATSRKSARAKLAELLETALVGAGKPTQQVAACPVPITVSPLVFVRSAGSGADRQGIGGTSNFGKWQFEILIYVAAATNDSGISPEQAADALDDIEAAVRDVLIKNPQVQGYWQNLEPYTERSQVVRLPKPDSGGRAYDVEIIPVEVQFYDQ